MNTKQNDLNEFLKDLYQGIASKKPGASKNPQDFRREIESIVTGNSPLGLRKFINTPNFPNTESGAYEADFSSDANFIIRKTFLVNDIECVCTFYGKSMYIPYSMSNMWEIYYNGDLEIKASTGDSELISSPLTKVYSQDAGWQALDPLNSNGEFALDPQTVEFISANSQGTDEWFLANTDPVYMGECTLDHIIPVDALPTDNIDKDSIYKLKMPFSDIILCIEALDMKLPLRALLMEDGVTDVVFYQVLTKPTENIMVSDESNGYLHVYFVVNENDLFVYADRYGTGVNEWISFRDYGEIDAPFQGIISDTSQAVEDGYYAFGSDNTYAYFKYIDESFVDVAFNNGSSTSLVDDVLLADLYQVSTKPTENINVSDFDNDIYYLYYIKDENDIFAYGDIDGNGTNAWVSISEMNDSGYSFQGAITDIDQATNTGYYAIVTEAGFHRLMFKEDIPVPTPTTEEKAVTPNTSTQTITPTNADYLSKVTVYPIPSSYVYPSGTKVITTEGQHNVRSNYYVDVQITNGVLPVTENGIHDVTSYKGVHVTIPTVYRNDSLENIPEDVLPGSIAIIWEVSE